MKPSEVIRQAAITARLLGYHVCGFIPYIGSFGIGVDSYRGWRILCPRGTIVMAVWSYYPKPEEVPSLGHFLVRLHMEQHYGIPTEHYWENVNFTGGEKKNGIKTEYVHVSEIGVYQTPG